MSGGTNTAFHPFPGLRPFEIEEGDLFFGREGQSEKLLKLLGQNRMIAVVGVSGSGKSSLVLAGLLPYLAGGFLTGAGTRWRSTTMRPGADPIGNLARALNRPEILGKAATGPAEDADDAMRLEVRLRRSGLGLVEATRLARLPAGENLLVVVDQFEELFRFAGAVERSDDAAAFVKLLLEAAGQSELPIYIVLTLRSDFIGDSARFRDLPEAVTNSLFLIPRMTRDQRRAVIEEPVRVGEAEISRRLVNRLLNEAGDSPDQLPILQHALMRTWDHWVARGRSGPVDIEDYSAIGGMENALSQHAEEAFGELDAARQGVAQRLFKSLTEKGADNREGRRPTKVAAMAEAAQASVADVTSIIEVFRRPGRSFLTPPARQPMGADSTIDISHESLIRGWTRLRGWVDEEAESATAYRRLADTAALHGQGKAGLWDDPDLAVALAWRARENPTAAWAQRHHPGFDAAMRFLDASQRKHDQTQAREARHRAGELRRARWLAAASIAGIAVVSGVAYYSYREKQRAEVAEERTTQANAVLSVAQESLSKSLQVAKAAERQTAQANKVLSEAKEQLSKTLDEAQRQKKIAQAQLRLSVSADADRLKNPQRALDFYQKNLLAAKNMAADDPDNAELQETLTYAYDKIADAYSGQNRYDEALEAYRSDLEIRRGLSKRDMDKTGPRQNEAWTLRKIGDMHDRLAKPAEAIAAYEESRTILQALLARWPDEVDLLNDLSYTHENIASALLKQEKLDEATDSYKADLEVNLTLARLEPDKASRTKDIAWTQRKLAGILEKQKKTAEAASAYRASAEILARQARLTPDDVDVQNDLSVSQQQLGDLLYESADYDEALDAYRSFFASSQRLEQLAPDKAKWKRFAAVAQNSLGDTLGKLKRFDEAVAAYDIAIALGKGILQSDPGNMAVKNTLGMSYQSIGGIRLFQDNLGAAAASYKVALVLQYELVAQEPDRTLWIRNAAWTSRKIGSILVAQDAILASKELAETATARFIASRDALAALALREPGNIDVQNEIAATHQMLGDMWLKLGKLDDALGAYRAQLDTNLALAAREPAQPKWKRLAAGNQRTIGSVLAQQKKPDEAVAPYRASMEILQGLAERDANDFDARGDLAVTHADMAALFAAQGRTDDALLSYSEAEAINRMLAQAAPANTRWVRDIATNLEEKAKLLAGAQRHDEAAMLYREGMELLRAQAMRTPADTDVLNALAALAVSFGGSLKARGLLDEALEAFRTQLTANKTLIGIEPEVLKWRRFGSRAARSVGEAYDALHKPVEALAAFEQARDLIQPVVAKLPLDTDNRNALASCHDGIGSALAADGQFDAAAKAFADGLRERETLARQQPDNIDWPQGIAWSQYQIAGMRVKLQDTDGALLAFRAALDEERKLIRRAVQQGLTDTAPAPNISAVNGSASINERIATLLAARQDHAGAKLALEDAAQARRSLVVIQPDNAVRRYDVALTQMQLSRSLDALGSLKEALGALREARDILLALTANDPAQKNWQASLWTAQTMIAYQALLAGEPQAALEAAEACIAHSADQSEVFVSTVNRGFALMLLGRSEEALAVFNAGRGKTMEGYGTWDAMALKGFARLRAVGITHPQMAQIEALIAATP